MSSNHANQPAHGADACGAFALLPSDLAELCPAAHAPTLFARLQRPWTWNENSPLLAAQTHALLAEHGLFIPRLQQCVSSQDGSTKVALELFDGRRIEAVHMPRLNQGERVTICISSQVGCALACRFCATARMGLVRQLSAGEIVAQVLTVVQQLGPRHPGALTLVFMGMGEPLHNFENVLRAVRVLSDPAGLGLSPRRITLSTAGLVPRIAELGKRAPRPLLAVSLNATTDALRQQLMPITRRYSISVLRTVLRSYPVRARERITVEYVLLAGINDSVDDAQRLADFCEGFPHQINLIPFNEHPLSAFRAPSETTIDRFARAILAQRRALVTVRRSRGADVQAACGQLVQRSPMPSMALLSQ